MRILFVAMANSIHTARWINQISDQGWDIHLFPSIDSKIHSELKNLTIHDILIRSSFLNNEVYISRAWRWPFARSAEHADRLLRLLRRSHYLNVARFRSDGSKRLANIIRALKPDIIHSLEIQHAGYLTYEARIHLRGHFPTWIVTNWGSDIYLFGRLQEYANKIKKVLATCDYYSCECQRDVELGKAFGFQGEVLPVLPNTGGFDLMRVRQLRQSGPTSARRLIVLKGYQDWARRALVGLHALELCADILKGYRIAVYLASPEVQLAAELVAQSTGIPIDIIPYSPHEEILRILGRTRIYLGLSISDAIPTSLLEAIVMGAFPIQSCTSCANEWIDNGKTGLIVPPEDPNKIALAIRQAISDDTLVDNAAEQNARLAAKCLNRTVIQPQVIKMYEKVFDQGKKNKKI